MDSSVSYSIYKRYKTDTSIFIKWLVDNGTQCGYKVTTSEDKHVEFIRTKSLVDIDELVPFANAIVASKKIVRVPADIIRAGLRAISARKRSAAFFQRETSDEDEKKAADNRGHSHFIYLMETVLFTLQPRFASSAGAGSTAAKSSDTIVENLENRFATLAVEEPSEPKTGPAPKTEMQFYELRASQKDLKQEENLFALFCLFDDLDRMRSYVLKTWEQFKQGKESGEILVDFPVSADYQDVLSFLIFRLAHKSAETGVEIEGKIAENLREWIYVPAYTMLRKFCKVLVPESVPMMKRGHLGDYHRENDRTKLSKSQRSLEDLVVLMEILPEFCFIFKRKIDMFAADELTRGLGQFAITKEIPVWLVFATTIFLDIHHILRGKVELGFTELQTRTKMAKAQFDKYFELSRGLRKPDSWSTNELFFEQIRDQMSYFILNDAIFPHKTETYWQVFGCAPAEATEKFYLYKRHPILCGIQAFAVILEVQQLGIVLNNGMGTVVFPAHFYNALKQNDASCASWPMMDEVIALHGAECMFVGGISTTIKDCFKQICLMLGYSPAQYAKNQRNPKPIVSKKGPRGLRATSPLTELFYQGLREPDGRMTVTLHNVEELLNDQARDADLAANPTAKKLRHEWATTKRLTSIQLLEALGTSIPQELPKLELDYFAMHAQSIGLLRRMKRDLDADYIRFFGSANHIENESQLPNLGPWALMAADRFAGSTTHADAGHRFLSKAAKAMEKSLREEGVM
ncbi:uncharacterized protein RCO7_10896 [Rhynchosporium graminicola]|uniref:DUF6604 domain-containing protein n=1 Tax=Rhynchosporium graminicola TaxID=2792576 RepID=A0A1E1L482_9HELO|nr:uncharacterized protein RCO7_10896 [Rhynchosporium commune]